MFKFLWLCLFVIFIPTVSQATIFTSGDSFFGFIASVEKTEWTQEEVVSLIREYSSLYGVKYKLAYELARIESNFNHLAKNPKSSAEGVYQWIKSSWKSFCEGDVKNAEDNIKCSMAVISQGGLSHWLADPIIKLKLRQKGLLDAFTRR